VGAEPGPLVRVPFDRPGGRDAARRLLDRPDRPTAVFASSDAQAFGLLHGLTSAGVRVPEDVAVVGWDDISMASFTHPTLTTVAPDTRALATTALDLLEERIAGFDGLGRHRLVAHDLVVRESAPAPSA